MNYVYMMYVPNDKIYDPDKFNKSLGKIIKKYGTVITYEPCDKDLILLREASGYPWKILSNADVLYWAVSRGIPIMKKVGWKWRRTKL